MTQATAPRVMRYEIRFCNGNWVIFDTWNYRPVEAFRLLKQAQKKFNAPA